MNRYTRNREKKRGKTHPCWGPRLLKKPSKRYRRCPRCKKLRMRWLPANWYCEHMIRWQKLEPNGPTVCHICVMREKGETFRNGREVKDV